MEDIIAAISTPNGVGGVAIIRVSGNGSKEILKKVFKPIGKTPVDNFQPYKMYVGEIDGGEFTDFGMAVFFKGPKSYTGEDMAEIHCHGGIAITQGILKQLYKIGAVPATRGEFTKRAFINGKTSLDSAEGLISMINSESIASVKVGYSLYREKLNEKLVAIQDDLTFALAKINADMDYPEEDLEAVALDSVSLALEKTINTIDDLVSRYQSVQKIKNGVSVAIVGKPNTGKSSLLNALLCYDKAIVSSIAGTTRDIVEGGLEINGVRFNLYDTAGIHETKDEIEKAGVERSEKIIKSANIILHVLDGSTLATKEDEIIEKTIQGLNVITIYNKGDLFKERKERGLVISAKTGEGIDLLKDKMYGMAFKEGIDFNAEFITEERHLIALNKAKEFAIEALNNIGLVPLDLIAEDIRKIWDKLGEITGKTASEEIINEIFSKFCVGK